MVAERSKVNIKKTLTALLEKIVKFWEKVINGSILFIYIKESFKNRYKYLDDYYKDTLNLIESINLQKETFINEIKVFKENPSILILHILF